jgi:hypothetical protein
MNGWNDSQVSSMQGQQSSHHGEQLDSQQESQVRQDKDDKLIDALLLASCRVLCPCKGTSFTGCRQK